MQDKPSTSLPFTSNFLSISELENRSCEGRWVRRAAFLFFNLMILVLYHLPSVTFLVITAMWLLAHVVRKLWPGTRLYVSWPGGVRAGVSQAFIKTPRPVPSSRPALEITVLIMLSGLSTLKLRAHCHLSMRRLRKGFVV